MPAALTRRNSIATVPIKGTDRQVSLLFPASVYCTRTLPAANAITPLFILRRSNSAHLARGLIAAAGGTRALYFRRRDKLTPRCRRRSYTCSHAHTPLLCVYALADRNNRDVLVHHVRVRDRCDSALPSRIPPRETPLLSVNHRRRSKERSANRDPPVIPTIGPVPRNDP